MTIESPCIGVCEMSEDQKVCIGCHRSLSEIANWQHLTDIEKIHVIAAAQARRVASKGQTTFEATPMNNLRIVSFLPAATEMAYALGLGKQVVGVSHECDF